MGTPYQLYLSKNKEMVYVDNCKVPHHRDGIRFLYRQYKKKKPGVIVNDPLKSSREVQTVIFIKAVCYLLTKPVLVLCHKDNENGWLDLFRNWTDLSDDVIIETTKPYLKKKVIINPMMNLPSFSIHEWSIVVVDGDTSSNVLCYPFKADFKIWSLAINMEENLEAFSLIYSWLTQEKLNSKYRCEKFNISEFVADKNNIKDIIEKAVRLDAFMEDIVIRRKESACNLEEDQNVCSTPKILSRKNKDATGTKIKRSKRRIEDNKEICEINTESVESIIPKIQKYVDMGNVAKENFLDQSKDNNNPIVNKPHLRELCNDFNVNTVNSQEMNLMYETDSVTDSDKIYEMDTLVAEEFSDVVPTDENKELANVDMDCDGEMNSNIYEILNRDNHEKWKLSKLLIQDTFDSQINMKYINSVEDYSENNHNQEPREQMNDTYSNELKAKTITSENEMNIVLHKEIIDFDDILPDNEILHTENTTVNEISNENQINIAMINDNSEVNSLTRDTESKMDFLYKDKLKYNINSKNEIKADEVFTQGKTNIDEADDNIIKTENTTNEVIQCDFSDIDHLKNQVLEKATKRFKGSILDSLF